jgi:hypothetical protein
MFVGLHRQHHGLVSTWVVRLRRQHCLVTTLFVGKSVLAARSLGECRTLVAGVLVTQAHDSGLAVLAPCCLACELDVEAATAEPQEDCLCGLVAKLVAAGGLLLACASSSLLAGTSGALVE